MKKIELILIFFVTCLITSCGKKTSVSGYIYTKQNVPVKSGMLILWITDNSGGVPRSGGKVDENGHYYWETKSNKNKRFQISCDGDSGSSVHYDIITGQVNSIDIYLK